MKKAIGLLVCVLMVLGVLIGCTQESSPTKADAKKVKIGIVQSIEHTSLTQIREAIIKRLDELGYNESNTEIDYKNAQGDQATLNSICTQFQGDKKDIVIPIGTTSTHAVCGTINNTKIVFSAVTDPVGAGFVKAFDQTDNNVTGISDTFPLNSIFELAMQMTPDIKKIGFIHCTSEQGAKKIIEDAKVELNKNFKELAYIDTTISNASELQQAVQSMVGKVDAIFVPNDNVVASAMPTLSEIARENKIPVYVTADSLVMDGGLATVGINYTDVGRETSNMVVEILKGKPISEVPVKSVGKYRKVINQTTADRIGVKLSDEIKKDAEIVTD